MSERNERKSSARGFLEFLVMLAVSFALVFGFVRPVVASPVYVPSESMLPTLEVWDRILVNKLADNFSEPDRGDIVVFESPAESSELLIKRAVGLPGETLELREGELYINGEFVEEPYVNPAAPPVSFGPVRIPEDHYFFMGDNRGNSTDSRVYGPVSEEALIGDALLRFWPPGRIGAV